MRSKQFLSNLAVGILLAVSVNSDAQIISTIAGVGTAGYSGDGGPATSAQLNVPNDIAFDRSGNLYIADAINVVRKISTSGIISTYAGNGTIGFSGDGGSATAAQFNGIIGLCVDGSGNLYIGDSYNNRIRKVTPSGVISTFAGSGPIGGFGTCGGDGGAATNARLYGPGQLTIDGSNSVYFADRLNHCIRKVDPSGVITTIAGTCGTAGYSGDGGAATAAKLSFPNGIVFDVSGNLYIADGSNHAVRKVTPSGIITTIAGDGTLGSTGDGGAATLARLNGPTGISLDGSSNIFISENGQNRIRKISASGTISTYAGNGVSGFSGDGGASSAAQLHDPYGICHDGSGHLFIADCRNSRIRKVSPGGGTAAGSLLKHASDHFAIFPNPTKGIFTVNLLSDTNEEIRLTITDATGKIVRQLLIATNADSNIRLQNLPEGIYYLSAETKSGRVSEKFVIE